MTDRPPLLGLCHVAINVVDLEASLAFYRDVVGMRVEWQPDADNVYLTSGRDNLALHRAQGPLTDSGSLDHIGFALSDAEAVDRWASHLEANGLTLEKPAKTHRDGARSLYVRDPSGVLVQFIHHRPLVPAKD
jgi:catechol 2,3-dioxygenase-like lactoylglutathione lyase family enzyme